MIHIAFSSDDEYVTYACSVIASIIDNNKDEQLNFHIISDSISAENEKTLLQWAKNISNVTISVYRISKETFADFPIANSYINVTTYFRLLLPNLLPKVDKIIYLDCDIIVNGSLRELWDTDISDYALAGVRDRINDSIHLYNRLRYPMSDGYVNAGILLINLKRWRDDNVFEKAKELAIKMPKALKNHDQDIINVLYHGQIKMLPFKYNLLEYYLYEEEWLTMDRKYYPEIIEACKNPTIIHFCMPVKPWHQECINPYKDLYKRYLAMTPWPNTPITHKKQNLTRKDRLKLCLEKFGLYRIERRKTLRKNINMIEDPNNIIF